jgi:hypothetical protein
MPTVIITIDDVPGRGVIIKGEGDFPIGSGDLVEKIAFAAVRAANEEMAKHEAAGEFARPIVSGDERAIEECGLGENADRIPETPPAHWWPTFGPGT